jgi:hypothetical protein
VESKKLFPVCALALYVFFMSFVLLNCPWQCLRWRFSEGNSTKLCEVSVDATNLGRLRGANAVVRNGVALHCRVHHPVLHTIGTRTELLTAVRPSSNFPPSLLLSAQEDVPADPANGDLGADYARDDHRRHCGSQSGKISCHIALGSVADGAYRRLTLFTTSYRPPYLCGVPLSRICFSSLRTPCSLARCTRRRR